MPAARAGPARHDRARPVRHGAARQRPVAAVPGRRRPTRSPPTAVTRSHPLGRPDRLDRASGQRLGPPARPVPAVAPDHRGGADLAGHGAARPARAWATRRRSTRCAPGGRGPTGNGCASRSGIGPDAQRRRAGLQGGGAGRHGPARAHHRRHRLGQERAAAHDRRLAGHQPLVRGAQLRPGRLQGRRHLRLAGRAAAHQRGHHQPGRGTVHGGPDAGRAGRRDDTPPGAAARGRQLRLPPRVRAGPRRRASRWRRCPACWSSATSSASCSRSSPTSSTCS